MIKVGYSTKDPRERANELGTGSPYPYKVEYEVLVDNPKKIEKLSHDVLSFVNEGKEWFKCDVSIALRAIKKACEGEKIYLEYPIFNDKESKEILKVESNSKIQPSVAKKKPVSSGAVLDLNELGTDNLIQVAEQGNANAQYELGQRYDSGNRVRKSLKDAFRCFLSAAEQGHTLAQLSVGKAYKKGRGIDKDWRKSLDFLKLAAEKGNVEAQYLFGEELYILDAKTDKHFLASVAKGDKSKTPELLAFEFIKLAADKNYPPALSALGTHYALKSDYKKSFEMYRIAADKGYPLAQRYLADYYLYGSYGCNKNIKEAKRWYMLAANGGDLVAKKKIENWESYSKS